MESRLWSDATAPNWAPTPAWKTAREDVSCGAWAGTPNRVGPLSASLTAVKTRLNFPGDCRFCGEARGASEGQGRSHPTGCPARLPPRSQAGTLRGRSPTSSSAPPSPDLNPCQAWDFRLGFQPPRIRQSPVNFSIDTEGPRSPSSPPSHEGPRLQDRGAVLGWAPCPPLGRRRPAAAALLRWRLETARKVPREGRTDMGRRWNVPKESPPGPDFDLKEIEAIAREAPRRLPGLAPLGGPRWTREDIDLAVSFLYQETEGKAYQRAAAGGMTRVQKRRWLLTALRNRLLKLKAAFRRIDLLDDLALDRFSDASDGRVPESVEIGKAYPVLGFHTTGATPERGRIRLEGQG